MDKSAVMAEMSAQSKLVGSIPMDSGLVSDIDRHIKEMEHKLNKKYVRIPGAYFILNYLPPSRVAHAATIVDEDVWRSLRFNYVMPQRKGLHEEISWDKTPNGFGFFYQKGYVTYDFGLCEIAGGTDTYIRILKDERETRRVIGAPVEVKLRTFVFMRQLVAFLYDRVNEVAKEYQNFAYRPR